MVYRTTESESGKIIPNLTESLKIFTKFAIKIVGKKLRGFVSVEIASAVVEPFGDTEFQWFRDDFYNLVDFRGRKISGTNKLCI